MMMMMMIFVLSLVEGFCPIALGQYYDGQYLKLLIVIMIMIAMMMMMMMMMTMTGQHLMALIGKNLPALFLVSKKGLGQTN